MPLFIQNITYDDGVPLDAAETTSVAEFPGGMMNGFGIPEVVPPPQAAFVPFGMSKYPPVLFFKTMKLPTDAPVLGNVKVPGVAEVML